MYTSGVSLTRFVSHAPRRAGASLLLLLALASVSRSAEGQVAPWATTLSPAIDSTMLPEDHGAEGLAQTLNKLRTWASLMMIVAHPDDEDGGMMAYESRGAGVRTTLMTLTRGEGGQNAMSGENYDALGLLRTNELLAADRYIGAEQIWGSVADYGFSKTKEEAFAQWGRDRVLQEVVRAVREQRPLVLTSVFLGGITDGHGHHQVSGELTQEAFNAAGDPNVFPEQIAAGLHPWKPLAVFERVPFAPVTTKGMYDYATDSWAPTAFTNYVTGERTTAPPTPDVTIPEGQFDPVLGRSYLQMAREGWGLQKSQYGGGTPPLAGPDPVSYHRYGSRVPGPAGDAQTNAGFFSGIDTSLPGMAMLAHPAVPGASTTFVTEGLLAIDRTVTRAFWGYTPAVPARIVPDLCAGYRATQALLDAVRASALTPDSKADLQHELGIKLVQFNTALVEALGLHLDALVTPAAVHDLNGVRPRALGLYPELSRTEVTPGEIFYVRLHVSAAEAWTAAGDSGLVLAHTALEASILPGSPSKQPWQILRSGTQGLETAQSSAGDALFSVTVPRDAAPTEPYFHRPSIEQAYYDLSNPALDGQSFAPYPLSASAEFHYEGLPVRLATVVQGVARERGIGTYQTPLVVVPGLSVTLAQHVAVVPAGTRSLQVEATLANEQAEAVDATLGLRLTAGSTIYPEAHPHLAPGECITQQFTVGLPPSGTGRIAATATAGNSVYTSGFETVGYPGLRPANLYRPALLDVRSVDVHITPGIRIAYVMGTGDEVPAALHALGVPVDLLTPAELLTRDLHAYTTVMLGVRTYTAAPALGTAGAVLRQFAAGGGTVLIEYQSSDFPGAPYALHLGNSPAKVVDERSLVTLLTPANPLLTTPNRISPADFDGWLEERGHGFAASWAPEWTPLLSTADPGQPPQEGGLLVAPVGKGRFIYVALALYRQLPEGIPGAYRLLANLVSTGAPQERSAR